MLWTEQDSAPRIRAQGRVLPCPCFAWVDSWFLLQAGAPWPRSSKRAGGLFGLEAEGSLRRRSAFCLCISGCTPKTEQPAALSSQKAFAAGLGLGPCCSAWCWVRALPEPGVSMGAAAGGWPRALLSRPGLGQGPGSSTPVLLAGEHLRRYQPVHRLYRRKA